MADEDVNKTPLSVKPIPDPTQLTTQQLLRELTSLKEFLLERIAAERGTITTRLDDMDKAIQLIQTIRDRIPEQIDEKVDSLAKLHEEKFRSIQTQFTERDIRTEQTARDSKVAVDAALQAAKEAVGEQNRSSALAIAKSEAATVKQIDQQGLLITTATSALDDKISDIKDRLTRIEGAEVGVDSTQKRQSTSNSFVLAIIAAGIAFISLIYTIIRATTGH